MKKVVVMVLLVAAIFMTGCTKEETHISKDEKKFKEEYEKINGNKAGEHKIRSLTIDEDNRMEYVSSKKVVSILENKTGVIYFGFPECPWCRNIVPVLIDVAKEKNVDKIYYANLLEERDTKVLGEDGTIITEKEGSESYRKIVDLLKDYLGSYEGLNDDSIKRLYFPTVVFVKNGKVESVHIGTVDSQKDPYKKLTEKQKKELEESYRKGIEKIQNLTCESKKSC